MHQDYVGNTLRIGMRVCTGWQSTRTRKRTARIVTFRDGWIVTDRHALALLPSEVLRCTLEG